MNRPLPYLLTAVGLVGGLLVLQSGPFPSRGLTQLTGAAFLAVAIASVTYMIAGSSGPDERGPEF